MNNKQNKILNCPECDSPLTVPDKLRLNQILECSACGVENEILSINPFKIAPLEEEK